MTRMMKKFQGSAVSPGVAVGEAFVMAHEGFRAPKQSILSDAIANELKRFGTALAAAKEEIAQNRDSVSNVLGTKYGDIFEAHLQILSDPKLQDEIESLIREKQYSAEYAVSSTMAKHIQILRELQSNYLAERANDIVDIEKRLIRLLLGGRRERLKTLTAPVILLASDLTPSETAGIDSRFVKSFVTEFGGPGCHTAIIAAALEIPAVVATGPFLSEVSGGDIVIVDGDSGTVIVRPDEETLNHYHHRKEKARRQATFLQEFAERNAITRDGIRIDVCGNIEFPHEAGHCIERGADGIGLFRTEFLYLTHEEGLVLSENEHFEYYKQVAEAMGRHRPVTIRTCDLGADKISDLDATVFKMGTHERNPALGLRSIRVSLRCIQMFRIQLRAILRASVYGTLRIMFPLVSTLTELRQAKMLLTEVKEELDHEKIPYDKRIEVGMMLEVPAAVMMVDWFVKEVDFFSIGTNDLIQYSLAVDRGNPNVIELYNTEDPAILKLVKSAIAASDHEARPICLCGQMSSNPMYAPLLIGMGLRQFSCSPNAIPEIKRICCAVDLRQCKEIADAVLAMDNFWAARNYLRRRYQEILDQRDD